MHLYKQKRFPVGGLIITVTVFAVIVAIFLYGFISATGTVRSQQKVLLEKAIDRAVINCYAIEGSYPESVAYLEEHYGVVINHEKYQVDYEAIGRNVKPSVRVIDLEGGGQDAQQVPLD